MQTKTLPNERERHTHTPTAKRRQVDGKKELKKRFQFDWMRKTFQETFNPFFDEMASELAGDEFSSKKTEFPWNCACNWNVMDFFVVVQERRDFIKTCKKSNGVEKEVALADGAALLEAELLHTYDGSVSHMFDSRWEAISWMPW